MTRATISPTAQHAKRLLEKAEAELGGQSAPVQLEVHFGAAVCSIRKASGRSQGWLAKQLDSSQAAITRIETAKVAADVGQGCIGTVGVRVLDEALSADGYIERLWELLVQHRRRPDRATTSNSSLVMLRPVMLPVGRDRLIGRDDQLAVMSDELATARREHRPLYVALDGPPGVGTTELASAWARRMDAAGEFPGGILHANLRNTAPGPAATGEILTDLLGALGVPVPRQGDASPAGQLAGIQRLWRSAVDARPGLLLILDDATNADQVIDLLPGVGEFAAVITTSCVRISAQLSARIGARAMAVRTLLPDDAAALLTAVIGEERAAAESDVLPSLTAVCEGLPLALVQVGEQIRLRPGTPLSEFAEQLIRGNPLDVLASCAHRPLRTVVSWLYRDLPADIKRAFRALALLPAGVSFEPQAVRALIDEDAATTVGRLEQLAQLHLIEPADVPGRYRMHRLYHRAALDLLHSDDSAGRRRAIDAAYSRLVQYYAATALAAADPLSTTPLGLTPTTALPRAPRPITGLGAALRWWAAEAATVHEVVHHAVRLGAGELAWMTAVAASRYFRRTGRTQLWIATLEHGLRGALDAGNALGQGFIGLQLGLAHLTNHNLDAAETAYRDNLARTEHGNQWARGWTYGGLATIATARGQAASAREHITAMERIFTDPAAIADAPCRSAASCAHADALARIGFVLAQEGCHDNALARLDDALAVAHDPATRADVYVHTAQTRSEIGDLAGALADLDRAIAQYDRVGSELGRAIVTRIRADILTAAGCVSRATCSYRSAAEAYRLLGDSAEADKAAAAADDLDAAEAAADSPRVA